jgi:hypothetical protein
MPFELRRIPAGFAPLSIDDFLAVISAAPAIPALGVSAEHITGLKEITLEFVYNARDLCPRPMEDETS